jgi:hypothetical protein
MPIAQAAAGLLRDSLMLDLPRKPPQSPDHLVLEQVIDCVAGLSKTYPGCCGTRRCFVVLVGCFATDIPRARL